MKKRYIFLFVFACIGNLPAWAIQYTYDDLNRLTRVDYDNGGRISYSYDAAGNISSIVKEAALFNLTVNKQGSGMVTSSPAGINCGSTCVAGFASGTTVNLYASPSEGSSFLGWSGACIGNGASCSAVMNANHSVTAAFGNPSAPGAPTITRLIPGSGTMRIAFNPPANTGGAAITSYTASCSANGVPTRTATGSMSPITITGLTNGLSYSCTVSATNSAGTGSASNAIPKIVRPASIAPILNILLD